MKNALAQHLISYGLTIPEDSRDPVSDWIGILNNLIHTQAISPLEFDRDPDLLRTAVTTLVLDPEDPRSTGFYHLFHQTLRIDCFTFFSNLINRDIRLGTIHRHSRLLAEVGEHIQKHYVEWLAKAQLYVDTVYPEIPAMNRLVLARLNVAIQHSVW